MGDLRINSEGSKQREVISNGGRKEGNWDYRDDNL